MATTATTIRSLRAGDEPRIIELWRVCGLTRPWNDPASDLATASACETGDVLVAELDGRIVGTAMIGFDGHRAWVYYLAVDPAHQGCGIGAQLMAEAERRLREAGAPKLHIMVRGDNAAVRGFYQRIGYQVSDVVVLGKRLDDAP
jgi:ribosomal protein S18 acetylase RimI-like enzyme